MTRYIFWAKTSAIRARNDAEKKACRTRTGQPVNLSRWVPNAPGERWEPEDPSEPREELIHVFRDQVVHRTSLFRSLLADIDVFGFFFLEDFKRVLSADAQEVEMGQGGGFAILNGTLGKGGEGRETLRPDQFQSSQPGPRSQT